MNTSTEGSVFEMRCDLPADLHSAFEVWSEPALVSRWLAPSDEYETEIHEWDFRLGGAYRLTMRHSGGNRHTVGGHFSKIERSGVLTFSWIWEDRPEMPTTVEVVWRAGEDGSLMTLRHAGFPSEQERDDHGKAWSVILKRLERELGSGSSVS